MRRLPCAGYRRWVIWLASPATSWAVFESEASTSSCTGEGVPRAMSRPKVAGMISAARALLEVRASSGLRSTGQETTWKVTDARKASMKSCEAGGLIEVLHDDGQVVHRQGDGRSEQDEQNQREHQRQGQRAVVAHDLGQFFAGLRKDSSHRYALSVVFAGELALLPRLLDHADEDVFEREAPFSYARARECHSLRSFSVVARLPASGVVVGDDVQAVAEQRDAPALVVYFQEIGRALRLVDANSSRWPVCRLLMPLGLPSATNSPATMKPRRLHCSASSR